MGPNVYKIIRGFCNGYFGRDDYDDKMIILEGEKWIVCRYLDQDMVTCVNFDSAEEKQRCIDEWSKSYTDDEDEELSI